MLPHQNIVKPDHGLVGRVSNYVQSNATNAVTNFFDNVAECDGHPIRVNVSRADGHVKGS